MALANFSASISIQSMADWIEFNVLSNEYNFYSFNELTRIFEKLQEDEDPNVANFDNNAEVFLERVVHEIINRFNCLKRAYPFSISEDGTEFSLNEDISYGGYTYLYCLIFSHLVKTHVLIYKPEITNSDRDLLQICSTFAAAFIVRGHAYSFGFPRPDGTGFLDALRTVYHKIGEGVVHDAIPAGEPQNVKDDEIDVIAWGDSPDCAPGKAYSLGQVASGANWKDKTVKGHIPTFHETWFSTQPVSMATAAIYIPFCIEEANNGTIQDVIMSLTRKFGEVVYRYRLPFYVQQAIEELDMPETRIHRYQEFSKVIEYVNAFKEVLKVRARS